MNLIEIYNKHVEKISFMEEINFSHPIGLKDAVERLDSFLKKMQHQIDYFEVILDDIDSYKDKILLKIMEDKIDVFKDFICKTNDRNKLLELLEEIFEKDLKLEFHGEVIDLKNINYNLYKKPMEEAKKEWEFFKKEKYLKMKELSIVKEHISNLKEYSTFVKKNNITHKIYEENEVSKNIKFNFDFLSSDYQIRRRSSLRKKYFNIHKRDIVKDELVYNLYIEEKQKIKNDLEKNRLILKEKEKLYLDIFNLHNDISELRNENKFLEYVQDFFKKNLEDIEFVHYVDKFYDHKNEKFKYTYDLAIFNILHTCRESIESDLYVLKTLLNDILPIFKKIRIYKHSLKNKELDLNIKQIEEDFNTIYEFMNIKNLFFQKTKDNLLNSELKERFCTWEETYNFLIFKFIEYPEFSEGASYIFQDKIGEDLIHSIFESQNKKQLSLSLDSLQDLLFTLKKLQIEL